MGRKCHKDSDKCVIIDDCFEQCEGIGGFDGQIPIFDWRKILLND